MKSKTLRGDRTAAEMKMAPERPAVGGESCMAGFVLMYCIRGIWQKKVVENHYHLWYHHYWLVETI